MAIGLIPIRSTILCSVVAEFNERGDLVIWVNVTRHTASFLLGYVVVVATESLKLLVLVRFQVSQPIYYITTAEIVIPIKLLLYE